MDFLEKTYSYSFEGITNGIYQFRFISEGTQQITKIVSITPIEKNINWYNIGFGNLENEGGKVMVNDLSEVNNQDFDEVLATVFSCILHFFYLNPSSTILFFGNTIHKHRLYKQKISFNVENLEQYLDILGDKIVEEVIIVEREHKIVRREKEYKRKIREKDVGAFKDGVNIKSLERYDKSKTADYQFVLFKLKTIG